MFEHLDDVNPPQPGPRERARVFNRADQLVRRRRIVTGLSIAVAVLLVVAIPGVLAASGGGSQKLQTAAPPASTSSTTAELPGVVTPLTETIPPTTTTTTQPSTTTTMRKAPPSTLVCRNSSNPSCGPFRWDPAPDQDQPATMTITWSPAQPKAGEKVTFRVTIDDPDDAAPAYNLKFLDYGHANGQVQEGEVPSVNPCDSRYGPWTPPAPAPGQYVEEGGAALEHTFPGAGSYTLMFSYVQRDSPECVDPYASSAATSAIVTVSP